MLEFIDMEHTPKNLLIRAVRRDGKENGQRQKQSEVHAMTKWLGVETTLQKLLDR